MNHKITRAEKLLQEVKNAEKSFNSAIDSILHEHFPVHFGKDGFRARGSNIYSGWIEFQLEKFIAENEIDKDTLQELAVNGKEIHSKPKVKKRKQRTLEQ